MNWFKTSVVKINEFSSDMFRDEKGGKFSSKKSWGHIFMALAGSTYVLDGLHWYIMNENAFNTMVIAGCSLIGMRTIKDILKKTPEAPTDGSK